MKLIKTLSNSALLPSEALIVVEEGMWTVPSTNSNNPSPGGHTLNFAFRIGTMLYLLSGFVPILTSIATFILNVVLFKLPWKPSKAAKFYNVLFLFMTAIIGYGLSKYGHRFIEAPVLEGYKIDDKVFGYSVIFRTMLGAGLYHLLHCILLLGATTSSDPRSTLQNGLWPIKVFVLAGCCVAAFYIPLSCFYEIFVTAVIGGIVSTLIQACLMVDVAYEYAEWLLSRYEASSTENYKYLLIGSTILFNVIPLGGAGYLLYSHQTAFEITLVFINLGSSWLMSFLSTLESAQDINPRAGIFQSSLLGCYNFYLLFSAMMGRSSEESAASGTWSKTLSTVGFFAAIFFVAFSAFRTGQASHKMLITETHVEEGISKGEVGKEAEKKAGKDEEAEIDEKEENEDYSRSFFHFIFLLAALQLALLLNQWQMPVLVEERKTLEIQGSLLSFWLEVGSSWVIVVLYIWTLFAPYFFPDRDFS